MYKIDQKIIGQTTKCDKEFACLKEHGNPCCIIDNCINGKVHFVKELKRQCFYSMCFGNSVVCLCPVRKEIYNKHGK